VRTPLGSLGSVPGEKRGRKEVGERRERRKEEGAWRIQEIYGTCGTHGINAIQRMAVSSGVAGIAPSIAACEQGKGEIGWLGLDNNNKVDQSTIKSPN
jgi:hypothetical protein